MFWALHVESLMGIFRFTQFTGLPFLLFPWEFQDKACLVMLYLCLLCVHFWVFFKRQSFRPCVQPGGLVGHISPSIHQWSVCYMGGDVDSSIISKRLELYLVYIPYLVFPFHTGRFSSRYLCLLSRVHTRALNKQYTEEQVPDS
jgi:hypothetical protein